MLIITIYMHVYGNNMHYISSLQYLLYVLHMEKYVLLYVGILNTKFEVQWSSFKGYIYVLFYIFHVQVFYKILLHKNTKIGLQTMGHNCYPWKFQQIFHCIAWKSHTVTFCVITKDMKWLYSRYKNIRENSQKDF